MKREDKSLKSLMIQSVAVIIAAAAFCLSACSGNMNTAPAGETGKIPDSKSVSATSMNEEDEDAEEDQYEESEEPYNELRDKHVRMRLEGEGWDLFSLWGWGRPDYRYGPSVIVNEDGSMDAWFASPGDSRKEYDWITYRHSDDGGVTWSDERVVLSSTPGSADQKSVCDPDVVYYKGYYYMAYTGTINEEGLCNNVFMARSKYPDGPFQKWGADGWDSAPVPIIYYYGIDIGWGVGEPSLVVKDDRLYVYSTLDSFSENEWIRATRVHVADLTDPEWPSKFLINGVCAYRHDHTDAEDYTYADSDSWDVAYLEESDKFIALTTNRRFTDDSCLLYYESYDGINFDRVSELNTGVICGCHNCGLSTDKAGHIKAGDDIYVGYAYSGTDRSAWGVWATRLVPVKLGYTDEIDRSEDGAPNLKQKITIDESLLSNEPIMLLTDQLVYTASVENPVPIKYYTMNSYRRKSSVSAKDINIEKYDHDMFRVTEENRLVPLREGSFTVGVEYNGLRRDINVRVFPQDHDYMKIRGFYPVCRIYDIKVNEPVIVKVRPMAVFGDYDLQELTSHEINMNEIKFRSSNISVCTVDEEGTVHPISPGTSVITVQGEDCRYTIDVYVGE